MKQFVLRNVGEVGPKCSGNKVEDNKFRETDREVSQGQGQKKSSKGFTGLVKGRNMC